MLRHLYSTTELVKLFREDKEKASSDLNELIKPISSRNYILKEDLISLNSQTEKKENFIEKSTKEKRDWIEIQWFINDHITIK